MDRDRIHHSVELRRAIGIILCLGPYNYPLGETYATLSFRPCSWGNIVILKIPAVGGFSAFC
jgi:glyceraldehyde-3-phosphate dehydrogenase (NADP+)